MLIGIDLSKRGCGVAFGDGAAPPSTLAQRFVGDRATVFGAFDQFLLDLIVAHAPRAIVFEAPLATSQVPGSLDDWRLKMGLATLTEHIAARRAIRCADVHVQTARKSILGQGRPKDPKGEVLRFCRIMGWEVGGDHNRADAAVVWAWGHIHHGNRRGLHRLLSHGSLRGMEARNGGVLQ